jgi:hypothetical protein
VISHAAFRINQIPYCAVGNLSHKCHRAGVGLLLQLRLTRRFTDVMEADFAAEMGVCAIRKTGLEVRVGR